VAQHGPTMALISNDAYAPSYLIPFLFVSFFVFTSASNLAE
jgi:hypothetical protein